MPIYLRSFYINKILDIKKKEREELDKINSKSNKIKNPNMKIR